MFALKSYILNTCLKHKNGLLNNTLLILTFKWSENVVANVEQLFIWLNMNIFIGLAIQNAATII